MYATVSVGRVASVTPPPVTACCLYSLLFNSRKLLTRLLLIALTTRMRLSILRLRLAPRGVTRDELFRRLEGDVGLVAIIHLEHIAAPRLLEDHPIR